MCDLSVSVIVVSRGRAELLPLCLTGLGQLYHKKFEIIVVTDPDGITAVQEMGWGDRVKLVPFDQANISAARNAGILQAAGDIVAFIDDDAVPEPSWLTHLTEPFGDARISAAGGFVRGRNGISYQWLANLLDSNGNNIPLDILDISAFSPAPPRGGAVKTEGTNCAFRRDKLLELGGFDPVFRFFHDESDLNMRLARASCATMLVPLAQVHHGYAASARRRADRAPTTLFEIGASTAVFLRKYAPENQRAAALNAFIAQQRRRLIRHMVGGGLEPRDIDRLLADLRAGIDDGSARPLPELPTLTPSATEFLPFRRHGATYRGVCMAGRWGSGAILARKAKQQVEAGNVVTVYNLSATTLYHHVRFHQDGYWLQTGGIFGRSQRQEPLVQSTTFRKRVKRESTRVATVRQNI